MEEIQVICKASGAIQREWDINWNDDNKKIDAKIEHEFFINSLHARNKIGTDKKVKKQKYNLILCIISFLFSTIKTWTSCDRLIKKFLSKSPTIISLP